MGDKERACAHYRDSLHLWRNANEESAKAWREEERLTHSEYAHYLLDGNTVALRGRRPDTQ